MLLPCSPLPTAGRVRAKVPKTALQPQSRGGSREDRNTGQGSVPPGKRGSGLHSGPSGAQLGRSTFLKLLPSAQPSCRSQLGQGKLWVPITGKCIRGWHPTYHFTRLAQLSFLSKICPSIESPERPLTREYAGPPLIIASMTLRAITQRIRLACPCQGDPLCLCTHVPSLSKTHSKQLPVAFPDSSPRDTSLCLGHQGPPMRTSTRAVRVLPPSQKGKRNAV